ncbi:thioredoxin-dependent thiol peroxidase [Plebeiibacterium marinum]|uniref:thioredoxin-dependent peroxiredoxin n=1 Tax=Plebeiibacterium marinum TaxID=2992111 RepID=A0AAE3SKW9_9BACT|nr:thioredoxin-dependent thiol peroxidase [Plebeiobacterium marinum]MCW3805960.1 thioredoxin-dependent thiol peroxidase [Plebeiobacterium marinum]
MKTLKEGDQAPVFTGKNQNGEDISLSNYLGKKVILYFYPKDNTPGCTAESCNLNDNHTELTEKGFVIIGVSPDSEASHIKFINKFGFKFDLIADTQHEILELYNAWGLKKMYGKEYMGVIRTTYIIDEKGYIEKIINKVKTKDHTNQIFTELEIA